MSSHVVVLLPEGGAGCGAVRQGSAELAEVGVTGRPVRGDDGVYGGLVSGVYGCGRPSYGCRAVLCVRRCGGVLCARGLRLVGECEVHDLWLASVCVDVCWYSLWYVHIVRLCGLVPPQQS